jgi:hypothetical protein
VSRGAPSITRGHPTVLSHPEARVRGTPVERRALSGSNLKESLAIAQGGPYSDANRVGVAALAPRRRRLCRFATRRVTINQVSAINGDSSPNVGGKVARGKPRSLRRHSATMRGACMPLTAAWLWHAGTTHRTACSILASFARAESKSGQGMSAIASYRIPTVNGAPRTLSASRVN